MVPVGGGRSLRRDALLRASAPGGCGPRGSAGAAFGTIRPSQRLVKSIACACFCPRLGVYFGFRRRSAVPRQKHRLRLLLPSAWGVLWLSPKIGSASSKASPAFAFALGLGCTLAFAEDRQCLVKSIACVCFCPRHGVYFGFRRRSAAPRQKHRLRLLLPSACTIFARENGEQAPATNTIPI